MQVWTQRRMQRVASFISRVTDPLYLSVPTFFIVALATSPTIWQGLLWWLVTTLFCCLAPWLYVIWSVNRGKYSDRHLTLREERAIPMLIAFCCVVTTFGLLALVHASRTLLAALTAVILSGLLAMLITSRWKISLHLMGISGMVTILVLVLGPSFLALMPAIFLVMWARYQLRAHTLMQTVAGVLVSISVTLLVFHLFFL